ncbi:MAG: ABC transporter permease [Defluviitaleaceae bacterium]|nr:ABC transporter permease [Defluviitaleaceae bacterium]
MKLTKQLAKDQLKINQRRTIWTLLGIMLSTSMITAVYGFAASGLDAILQIIGDMPLRQEYITMVVSIGVILSIIIMAVSITVMSNAFRVSAGKRTMQFGILKSVGATKSQIASTILHESIYLSLIGIPLGLATGLIVQLIGVEIANHFLSDLGRRTFEGGLIFNFVISWQAVIASVLVAAATISLSAWFPARKAAKIPAIDAIRGKSEVVVQHKHVRTWRITKALFGFEGTLAAKSIKRSKRNLRATVLSITVSIIMFIAASGFGSNLTRLTGLVFLYIDSDVIGTYQSVMVSEEIEGIMHLYITPLSVEHADNIHQRLSSFPDTTVFGAGSSAGSQWGNSATIPRDMLTQTMWEYHSQRYYWRVSEDGTNNMSIEFIYVDAENYARLCRLAGVPYGSNILINHVRRQIEGNWTEFIPFNFAGQTLEVPHANFDYHGETQTITLHGELRGADIPREILHISRSYLTIIVPPFDAGYYAWFAETSDPFGFEEYMIALFAEFFPEGAHPPINTFINNITANQNNDRNIARLFMTFIYGFVAMLTLVGLTNVISTISTNVSSRSNEFAVLKSVGMTQGGLNCMLNLESILCSAKSLIFGLPLGVAASYLIYRAVMTAVGFPYQFPWIAIAQCIAAVFIITWATMRFAARRLKDENIVDSIRRS